MTLENLAQIEEIKKLDNNKIISCFTDKMIKIWDVESGKCLKTLKDHRRAVYQLEILT